MTLKHIPTSEGRFKIEEEVTRPIYKISNFKSQDDIANNSRRIIFPYYLKSGNAQPIPELEFKASTPKPCFISSQ